MDILSIIFIGIGLSMDAFAVSISNGIQTRNKPVMSTAFKLGIFFGGFQMLMPILGWFAGTTVRDLIAGFDHWIAFGLLAFVGGKMIFESFNKEEEKVAESLTIPTLFLLAIATSIDAFAVGLSLSFLKTTIFIPAIIIGLITFTISFTGVFVGNKIGHFFENKAELVGGIVLIGIGIKILLEHLF